MTKAFIDLEAIGLLTVERTLILNQRPQAFLCSNGKAHFLFYETEYERDSTTWLMVPVKTAVAKDILNRQLSIQAPFLNRQHRSSDDVFTVFKRGHVLRGVIRPARKDELKNLPENAVYKTTA